MQQKKHYYMMSENNVQHTGYSPLLQWSSNLTHHEEKGVRNAPKSLHDCACECEIMYNM